MIDNILPVAFFLFLLFLTEMRDLYYVSIFNSFFFNTPFPSFFLFFFPFFPFFFFFFLFFFSFFFFVRFASMYLRNLEFLLDQLLKVCFELVRFFFEKERY